MENTQNTLTPRERLHARLNSQRNARSKRVDLRKENYSVSELMREMVADKAAGLNVPKLSKKYLQLKQDYPEIYNMVIKRDTIPEAELSLLDKMIATREQLREGTLTADEAKDSMATEAAKIFMPHILEPSGKELPEQDITITEL